MRIAVVAHSATRAGGVETYLSRLTPALAAAGHDVACWFESAVAGADPVVRLSRGPVWIGDPASPDAFASLRHWKPDVIYLHGLRSVALEHELTTIAPVAFFAHSYYGACISGEKSTRFPILSPCDRVFGAACLAHYLPRGCGGLSPVTMLRDYDTQTRRRDLLAAYDTVLVASAHMAAVYAAHGTAARIVPLPAAASAPAIHARKSPDGSSTLLFLGRLERSKGASIAVQSAALAARTLDIGIRLIVAGQGSRASELRREAASLSAGHPNLSVEFPGWLNDDGRAAVLRETDLLLVPSLWPEPFGLVGVEAASAAVPAVAFNVGGVGDWLIDGFNGRLVTLGADRVQRFADAIVATLSDRGTLINMRQQAVAMACRFTMAAHIESLERVLRETVARAMARPSVSRTT